jgi:hypothetical protein
MHARKILGVAAVATLLAGLGNLGTAVAATPEENLIAAGSNAAAAKLGPWLSNVHEEYQNSSNKRAFRSRNSLVRMQGGLVGVDLYANDAAGLQRSLALLGARNVKSRGPLVSAQVPVGALGQLAALPTLRFAIPSLAKVRVASQGDVVSQGDVSLGSNAVRTSTRLDGTGVTVGVMSDSYQCNPAPFVPGAPTTTAAEDEATQDVPPGVEVLDNGPCPGSDEGRGMVQLVHDVAPGAAQKFHTAFNSLVDFADGILELQEAGSDVIVDDVIYFAENMFSDGIIAQAADIAVARGAAYFSSAGNQARQSYESAYREVPIGINGGGNNNGKGKPFVLPVHDFDAGAGTDTLQKIHVTPDGTGQALVIFSLQWDQPFLSSTAYAQATDPNGAAPRGATGDLDMLIYTDKGVLVPRCPPGVSTGITCQLVGTRNVGGDAVDLTLLFVGGPKSKTNDFFVRIARVAGEAPAHVKYVKFDAYFSALVQDAPGACIPACLNDFSSAGGIPTYLDKYGAPLATPVVRPNPRVTGPDGGNTTFFSGDSSFDDDDGDGCNSPTSTFITPCLDDPADELPNFFGTSASAPHVAGVAALMLQKNGGLDPNQIYGILRATAEDITKREVEVIPGPGNSVFSPLPAGFDFDSGEGFVDAVAAVGATPSP